MADFIDDIRVAFRTLGKGPVFAFVAIASLALGIAVNATVFAWMQRIILSPLPGVAASHEMVALKTLAPDGSLIDSSYLFEVLNVKPILGRTFAPDEPPGGAPYVVIGERLWHVRFQCNSKIIGTTIKLNQEAFSIIAVVPANFQGTIPGLSFDLWVPITMQSQLTGSWNWLADRDSPPLALMGRLGRGHTLREAQAGCRS